MTPRLLTTSRRLAALGCALALTGVASVHAVTTLTEPTPTVTIYKQLGFAFGYTYNTPTGLFPSVGGGGGGGGGGGFAGVPPLNLGPGDGNFAIVPGAGAGGGGAVGGGGGAYVGMPGGIVLGGAPIVGGGGGGGGGGAGGAGGAGGGAAQQSPSEIVAAVPDAGVGVVSFGFVLAGLALISRFLAGRRMNGR